MCAVCALVDVVCGVCMSVVLRLYACVYIVCVGDMVCRYVWGNGHSMHSYVGTVCVWSACLCGCDLCICITMLFL